MSGFWIHSVRLIFLKSCIPEIDFWWTTGDIWRIQCAVQNLQSHFQQPVKRSHE